VRRKADGLVSIPAMVLEISNFEALVCVRCGLSEQGSSKSPWEAKPAY